MDGGSLLSGGAWISWTFGRQVAPCCYFIWLFFVCLFVCYVFVVVFVAPAAPNIIIIVIIISSIIIIMMIIIVFLVIIIIALKGAIRDCLQSPHCAANRLQHARSSGLGAIVCKSRAAHRALIMCNMSCYAPLGTKKQLSY